jgi:murein DD-endopeptidase MepM/ murein hydrolase activator NlpD
VTPVRRLLFVALPLAAAVLASTARADTFAVVPTPAVTPVAFATPVAFSAPVAFSTPLALPSSAFPNLPGGVATPAALSTPPAMPVQLDYPQLLGLWQSAGAAYGIPWQVLAAINKVESNFGRNMGPSSAGAIGWMQFMPSTWERWGMDANGDGIADPWNPDDAVYSAARYLAAAGGATDLAQAVYSYNHAGWYVNEVLGLAQLYGQGSDVAFSLDRLQQTLDAARRTVALAGDRLTAARSRSRALQGVVQRRTRRAAAETLLSSRLDDEARAGRVEERLTAAQATVDRLSAAVADARAELVRARAAAAPSSFAPTASALLGGPSYSSGWAFPVGGGPGVVTVGHTHHDYPAADIAAPEGAPVYALAQSVVLRSWTQPDPSCGIGLTLQTFDGQTWTYCHLSYLEPTVVPGVSLSAGQPVGLVGSTGDATGPHLHLQLDPTTSYPQDEAWFASFAGVAFTWQDGPSTETGSQPIRFTAAVAPAPGASASGRGSERVFAVVPQPGAGDAPVVLFSR